MDEVDVNYKPKIPVPLYAIVGYGAFVVVASLLVGILPPLVNRPPCIKDDDLSQRLIIDQIRHQVDPIKMNPIEMDPIEESKMRVRKSVKAELREVAQDLKEKRKLDSLMGKVLSLPTCSEASEVATSTPWGQPRLPGNVRPSLYDLEFDFTQDEQFFVGHTTITFSLTSSTNYILINSRLKGLAVDSFKNKNNADVALSCAFTHGEYYVIKTTTNLLTSDSPFKLALVSSDNLDKNEDGLFRIKFNENKESSLIISRFEPVDAREAYPCLDEPEYKAEFKLKIVHKAGTKALSNMKEESSSTNGGVTTTQFDKTPKLATYLIGLVVFDSNDFSSETKMSDAGTPITLWANKRYFNSDFHTYPLDMAVKLFNTLQGDILKDVPNGAPPKIDIFATPDYSADAIPHFGLPIFNENKLLFTNTTVSERDKQTYALLIAKNLAEFWFGNLVTFKWWNELWLQEAFSDYIKYKVVDYTFGEFLIENQFITEELIQVLIYDGYPSSHPVQKPNIQSPYDLEAYFDIIESSKAAAILRMVENELPGGAVTNALVAYLKQNEFGTGNAKDFYTALGQIDKWDAEEFFKRWILQSNYPVVTIKAEKDPSDGNANYVVINQKRHVNAPDSIFGDLVLYPTEYDFTWYIPLNCYFGNGPNGQPFKQTFYIDQKTTRVKLRNQNNFDWIHCNTEFYGYYATDYEPENWDNLAKALRAKNTYLEEEDRANIIHDVFINAYTERDNYYSVVSVLNSLNTEEEYLPWRTIYLQMKEMGDILQYKRAFYSLSRFFEQKLARFDLNELFKASGEHITDMLRETLIQLGMEMQVKSYLQKASELWTASLPIGSNNLPGFVRSAVYNYHIQNTYDVGDWNYFFTVYEAATDFAEERRFLQALTFTKLPWLLAKFLESFEGNLLRQYDFFEVIRQLSFNPLGREIAWDYVRINKDKLIEQYSYEDIRIGQMILDITDTFENEFLYGELVQFIINTPPSASNEAFFQALEVVTANVNWLKDNLEDITEAFLGDRSAAPTFASVIAKQPVSRKPLTDSLKSELKMALDERVKQFVASKRA